MPTVSAARHALLIFEALTTAANDDPRELRAELIALAKAQARADEGPDAAFRRVFGLRDVLARLDRRIESVLELPHRQLRLRVRMLRRKWGALLGPAPKNAPFSIRSRFHDSPADRELNDALCAVLDAWGYAGARAATVAALEKVAEMRFGNSHGHPREEALFSIRRQILELLRHGVVGVVTEPQIRLEAALDDMEKCHVGYFPAGRQEVRAILQQATQPCSAKRKLVLAGQVLSRVRSGIADSCMARFLANVRAVADIDRAELLEILDEAERTSAPNAALRELRSRLEGKP